MIPDKSFLVTNSFGALAAYEGSDVFMLTYVLASVFVICFKLIGIVVLAVKYPSDTPLCKLVKLIV